MKRMRVIIAPSVEGRITAQVLYIAEDSIDNALAWEERLRASILAIGEAPGHAVDEEAADRVGFPVRKVVFEGTYLIHFVVDESARAVRIANFRHGARLPRHCEP